MREQALLDAYDRYGLRTAPLLNGPFSWVLWDGRKRRLVACADRLGCSPLYYTVAPDGLGLSVSTSIEALLNCSDCGNTLNERALLGILCGFGPPPGETCYSRIRALSPGTCLVRSSTALTTHSYWQPGPRQLLRLPSTSAYVSAYRDLLVSVVRQYAPAEPFGVCLSSGLDSSSVAYALGRTRHRDRMTALTWAMPGVKTSDESGLVADFCTGNGIALAQVPADRHPPFAGGEEPATRRADPYWNLFDGVHRATFAAAARAGVKTVLTGVGGDLLFGQTVSSYPDLLLSGRWRLLAEQLAAHHRIPQATWWHMLKNRILAPTMRAYLPQCPWPVPLAPPWIAASRQAMCRRLFGPPKARATALAPGRIHRLELWQHGLRPWTTAGIGRLASSEGAEYRHPLLDHRLVDFALSLPTKQTYEAGRNKMIVRRMLSGAMQQQALFRRDRITPGALAMRGVKSHGLGRIRNLLTDMRLADLGLVEQDRAQQSFDRQMAQDRLLPVFVLTLAAEDWLRKYW